MAIPGTFQTYDLATGVKLNVEDAIWLISPHDVPLQGSMGADGRTALSTDSCFEKKVEWLDEVLLLPSSAIVTGTASTTTTILSFTAGTGINFQTGDVLLIDAEQVQITSYGTTADYVNVTRGFNTTTAASYTAGDVVVCLGSALAEGSAPPAARATDRVDRFNYTQIFGPIGVQVSGTEQVVQKYGLVGTEFDHQVANRIKEAFIQREYALMNGIASAGSGTVGRTMGGFTSFITSNIDSTTTTLTDTAINALVQNCYTAGGTPDRFMVGPKQKRTVSGLDSSNIRYEQQTNTRGQVVDFYDTDFGRLSIILNRWCGVSQGFVFEREQATISTLRPMQFEMLAKTGDNTLGQVLSEMTLKFRMQSHAARFSALT